MVTVLEEERQEDLANAIAQITRGYGKAHISKTPDKQVQLQQIRRAELRGTSGKKQDRLLFGADFRIRERNCLQLIRMFILDNNLTSNTRPTAMA